MAYCWVHCTAPCELVNVYGLDGWYHSCDKKEEMLTFPFSVRTMSVLNFFLSHCFKSIVIYSFSL